jgi:uncharacterized membrane protein YcfT
LTASSHFAATPSNQQRHAHAPWADIARGLALLLVVLLHVREWHYLFLGWTFPGRPIWDAFIALAGAARMPTFFAVSGFLAAGAVTRPWSAGARKRVATWGYLYVLWLAIFTVVSAVLPDSQIPQAVHGLGDAAVQLLIPQTALWYLWALAAYFLVARLTVRAPIAIVLAAAGVLSLVATSLVLPDAAGMWLSILKNLFYFLIGCRLPWLLRAIADAATARRAVLLGALYLVAQVGLLISPPVVHWFGADVIVGSIAIAFVVTASSLLAQVDWFRQPVSWIGCRTASIFLMQTLAFLVLNEMATSAIGGPFADLVNGTSLGFVYPLVVTAAIAAACLSVGEFLNRRAPALMRPPARLLR